MKKIKHIMLVDDDDTNIYVTRRFIEKAGIAEKVTSKKSGEEALAYFSDFEKYKSDPESEIDLIFLDINMPVMDGFEFLEEFEKLTFEPALKKVKIIMLTSSVFHIDRFKSQSFPNVISYISKPVSIDSLKDIAERYF